MYLEEEKSIVYKITMTKEEARMLKELVQNPQEDIGIQGRAFCEKLFNLLSEA